jgi:hypothetical protein
MRLRWVTLPLALLLEICVAQQALSSDPPTYSMLFELGLLHVAACAMFGWAYVGRQPSSSHTSQVLAGSLAFVGLPVFGMLGVLVGTLLCAMIFARRPPQLMWDDLDLDETSSPEAAGCVDLRPALAVQPLVDLLASDDTAMKRGAVDALVNTRQHLAVPALKPLLRDPDAETRLYASLRLVTLEDDIGQEILAARTATEQSPDNPGAWSSLARVYLKYVASGLLDLAGSRHYLDQAVEAYTLASRLHPRQHRLALAIGRAYLDTGDLVTARHYLEYAEHGDTEQVDARLALMELAFRAGAWNELASSAVSMLAEVPADHPDRQLVNWWAGAA